MRASMPGAKRSTTVAEAHWLEAHGCDVVIAQGLEAGGHRSNFLSTNMAAQVGTFALVPQVADAVKEPVVAAGGISDARGIAAALTLGASAAQVGSAYLHCPESKVLPPHRAALKTVCDDSTVVTNVMTGRPARGIVNRVMRELGPISALAPLHAKAQSQGLGDFSSMWAGQAAGLGRALPARELTTLLAQTTRALLRKMAS
jgi:nitronate monooxygenase